MPTINGTGTATTSDIIVFNGEKSGTKNAIDYAERKKVPIHYIKG